MVGVAVDEDVNDDETEGTPKEAAPGEAFEVGAAKPMAEKGDGEIERLGSAASICRGVAERGVKTMLLLNGVAGRTSRSKRQGFELLRKRAQFAGKALALLLSSDALSLGEVCACPGDEGGGETGRGMDASLGGFTKRPMLACAPTVG